MIKEKLYTLERWGYKRSGGTQAWFSRPMPREEAEKLAEIWKNPNYIPTEEECSHTAADDRLAQLEEVILKEYKKKTDYADRKMRQVTVEGRVYSYQTITQEDSERITTIFDSAKNEIYKYRGDPHDYQPNGVKRIIREEGL